MITHPLITFSTGQYTVTRVAAGGYDSGGYAIAGAVTVFTIDASIQPLTGKDLKVLPEGQHAEQTRWVYTATALLTGDPTHEPDVVTYQNEPWVVVSIEEWNYRGTLFYRARVARRTIP